MNKPLARRAFMKLAAAAPAAFQAGVANQEKALADVGAYIGPSVPGTGSGWGYGLLTDKKIFALYQAGLLPEWARKEIEADARERHGARISPNVAALRSVSVAGKFAIQQQRTLDLLWNGAGDFHARQLARRAFFERELGSKA